MPERTKKKNIQLKTVSVPEAFSAIFEKAEGAVDAYFKNLHYLPDQGTIEINGERYVLVRASALSYEFLQSFQKHYSDQGKGAAQKVARNFLFDIAHILGMEDARNFHKKMKLKDPLDKLSAGPVHFAFTGWAKVEIHPESQPSVDENFLLQYDHPFSFEADSWIRSGKTSKDPVCIMNAGYSSGWCEASFEIPLTAIEITCKAKGDKVCSFLMAHPDKINEHLKKIRKKAENKITAPSFLIRKKMEEQLKKNLQEKEILLKEVHHRVKNNLQIVSSLLNLQSQFLKDTESKEKFQESIGRIHSIALIHELFYRSKDFTGIKFSEYVRDLVNHIQQIHKTEKKVKIDFSSTIDDTSFDLDKAIPCGLILNELISNSFKHAFSGISKPEINIKLFHKKESGTDTFFLEVVDNGKGFSSDIFSKTRDSLGLQLVNSLVTQLEGVLTIDTRKGTRFSIQFS